mgnify:CR=1 FL=1|jgi:hypothetical protein
MATPTFNLRLKKFKMSQIKDDSVVIFIGKRNTGKTYLTLDLLFHNQDMPIGTVISATEGANQTYSTKIPPIFIHDTYTPELVEKVIKRQKLINYKKMNDHKYANIDSRAFLLLDDCMYDSKWTRDVNIRYAFMNGRHQKLFFILTMQYIMGIPPQLRSNVDYVFILRENMIQNRKRIYEQYAGMFPCFDIFCQVMDSCTEDYQCLVIHNGSKSNKLQDQVFWYKAEPHPEFRLCLDHFWKKSAREYNPRFNLNSQGMQDDDDDENNGTIGKKKNAVMVNLKKDY